MVWTGLCGRRKAWTEKEGALADCRTTPKAILHAVLARVAASWIPAGATRKRAAALEGLELEIDMFFLISAKLHVQEGRADFGELNAGLKRKAWVGPTWLSVARARELILS